MRYLLRGLNNLNKRAIVLLSGGLDSAVTLFFALDKGYDCRCLMFDYGQRHIHELSAAGRIVEYAGVPSEMVRLSFPWKASSLLDKDMQVPCNRSLEEIGKDIPSTYVPGRNTVFLSIAVSFAEAVEADSIFIGAHSQDSSGYPDCRIEYLEAFNKVIKLGTGRGLKDKLKLEFPLINKNKKDIIRAGMELKVPFHLTRSCYEDTVRPCMKCDSCILRAKGFLDAGIEDPALGYSYV